MGLLGSGVLAIWNDVAPGRDAEFIHWHTREHIPERVGVPGFLRGRRYAATLGNPSYFTLYETESLATLAGPAYIARLNDPTPWTRRALPLFMNTKRTACRVTLTMGDGIGGVLAALDLGPASGREEERRGWLAGAVLPDVNLRPGIVGAHLCEADVETTQVRTEEKKLRDRPDALARWVILIEGTDHGVVEAACGEHLSAEALGRRGAQPDRSLGTYRLQYTLSR